MLEPAGGPAVVATKIYAVSKAPRIEMRKIALVVICSVG
jgi:hypothetical protein